MFTLVYGLPIYWLAGLNEAPDRFLLNFLMVWPSFSSSSASLWGGYDTTTLYLGSTASQ